jgi:hypothetical protein
MDADKVSSAYADVSVVVARHVPDANCFNGDAGAANKVWSDHKSWSLDKPIRVMRENLQWKISAALKCLDRSRQNSFFADMSVAIAEAAMR